ncbi:hypothetical protein BH18VER1_BH18VER1_18140 [soil metagenome]
MTALLIAATAQTLFAAQADNTRVNITAQQAGPTPFISNLTLTTSNLAVVSRIQFSIAPRPGSVTRPISATYTKGYLRGRGYVNPIARQLVVPVFGLYEGYNNTVTLTYFFNDGSSKETSTIVATQHYDDACPFDNPGVVQARTASKALSYDFILVSSGCSRNSPTVLDTDGLVRWVGTAGIQVHYTGFFANGVYLTRGSKLVRVELDGQFKVIADYASEGVTGFHHNMDPGKFGIILDVNTSAELPGSVHLEVDRFGQILRKWNLAAVVRKAMIAGGDDPSGFVKAGDWAHDNAAAYRRSDDSIIISSRENFVICLDYETSAIKWILGDTTKLWYQYPSLRRFALSLAPGTIAPAGQHAVSITKDDHLLLFDNGRRSDHHTPPGVSRTYSAARKYKIDQQTRVATEVWSFTNNENIYSPYRSSVYEDAAGNYLVDYAVARNPDGTKRAQMLGLTASGEKVFDYRYPTIGGFVAYRALPLHWENLQFPLAGDAQLSNISARSRIAAGDDVGIDGFIVTGPGTKKVVLRGLGPSLANGEEPIAGRLTNPRLELHEGNDQTLQVNDDFAEGPDAEMIAQAGLTPKDGRESAILAELSPGAYTVVLRGSGTETGVGLVELFDIGGAGEAQIGNLSARAFTSTGDNVLIGGLILSGSNPTPVLFRALGPALEQQGVSNALADPILEVFDADGVKIASNDDWREAPNAAEIEATGLQPVDERESAILITAGGGAYTFIARGKESTEGAALVEAYRLN